MLSQVLNLAYPASILVFDQFHGSIAMYYAVTFITTAYSTFSIAIASVADVVSPKNRATGFAILMAVASCGFVISAAVSATMTTVNYAPVIESFSYIAGPNPSSRVRIVCFAVSMGCIYSRRNVARGKTSADFGFEESVECDENFISDQFVSTTESNHLSKQFCQ